MPIPKQKLSVLNQLLVMFKTYSNQMPYGKMKKKGGHDKFQHCVTHVSVEYQAHGNGNNIPEHIL